MPQIVQFFHPGSQQGAGNKNHGELEWKKLEKPHARKFLKATGTAIDKNNEEIHDELTFWGEWEAKTKFQKTKLNIEEQVDLGDLSEEEQEKAKIENKDVWPKNVFTPVYPNGQGEQNTDPIVFGKNWYYSNCKQQKLKKILEDGSIIIFGSAKNGKMIIDTVFVVDSSEEYGSRDLTDEKLLKKLAIDPLKEIPKNDPNWKAKNGDAGFDFAPLRLYTARKYSKDNKKLFSFVPAKLYDNNFGNCVFKRIALNLKKEFPCLEKWCEEPKSGAAMNVYVSDVDINTRNKIWDYIKNEVLQEGLLLGVDFKEPADK